MGSRGRASRCVLAAAALMASACAGGSELRSSGGASPTLPPSSTTVQLPESASGGTTSLDTTTTEPDRSWRLLAGGDVLMTRTEPAGIDPFALLDPPLGSSDFSLVNVEMAISDRGEPHWKEFVFRAPPSAAERIAAGGVSVANLANNHANDYGPDALTDTIDLLEAAGVTTIGAGRDADEAYQYRLLSTGNGVRVAFVGASMIVPAAFAAGATTPGIASAHSPARARVLDTVRAAAAEADAVIVAVHWGIERDTCPSNDQRLLARQLLDAGADAVIGHHPHVLQPVELVGRKLVAYSLGNFIWHVRSGVLGETGILQIDFDGDGVTTWEFHPHVLDADGAPAPADSGERVERIRDIISGNCAPHDPPPPERTST
ncbi:MAG: CapA family protein, partial [Acidimicrobiaceae bacterium]|nr:CapA family protein [Acidimicrobiaceae bacterium]